MKSDVHIPVLLNEVIEGLNIKPNGIYIDATLGRGGHSKEILRRLDKKGLLVGIDQDTEAIEYCEVELSKIATNRIIVNDNFLNIDEIITKLGIHGVDGILFDLGVSSPHFDEDYRGFSYKYDNVLDMRMNQKSSLTAKDIVNNYSYKDLVRIFKEYGEEKYSTSIARNICKCREEKEIQTTLELVDIIKKSKPDRELKKQGHPAKQVFQALRIEVNDELNVLKEGLTKATKLLNIGGRIAVISFHSLEDRIVKEIFKGLSVAIGNRINDYKLPSKDDEMPYRLVNKKVIIPSDKEMEINPRSKSAKLRIIERIK